jgi:hypothetical protein
MPTLEEVRNKANTKLADFWTKLQARQDAFYAKHGRYFQLLAGSELTESGADTTFTVRLPSDETKVVDIDTSWSETVPFQIEVHVWDGATPGYKAYVYILYNGERYGRDRDNLGTDTGWYKVRLP